MRSLSFGFWIQLLVLGGVLSGGIFLLGSKVPCKTVLPYSLGNIDERFGIKEEALLLYLAQSEEVWEEQAGRELFVYQEGAPFKLNLIFDERQERTQALKTVENQGKVTNQTQGNINSQYESLKEEYEKMSRAYEEKNQKYQERLESYNRQVTEWNARGGAPEREYAKLEREKKALAEAETELEGEQQKLNVLVGQINSLADREEKIVEEYNSKLEDYEERYGPAHEFDQGEYAEEMINIYQFRDPLELRLVLAHEFGHALGLKHVENPASLLYYLMGEQIVEPLMLTAEDRLAFENYCAHPLSLTPGSILETARFFQGRLQSLSEPIEEEAE